VSPLEWLLFPFILMVAAWDIILSKILDSVRIAFAFAVLNPWISFIAIGVGALALLLDTASRRRRREM